MKESQILQSGCQNTNVVVGMTVDVMPSASSINAIAQGVIKEVGPSTFGDENKLRVKKTKC